MVWPRGLAQHDSLIVYLLRVMHYDEIYIVVIRALK